LDAGFGNDMKLGDRPFSSESASSLPVLKAAGFGRCDLNGDLAFEERGDAGVENNYEQGLDGF